jgi:hypothetical protein
MNEIYYKSNVHYDFAPIQQLARYHLVIMDILRELEKKNAPQKEVKAVRKAEGDVKKLMERIYAMRNLSSRQRM